MMRRCLSAMILVSLAVPAPAMAERIMQLAVPTQQPERPPQRPVGDPDVPSIGLDLFEGGLAAGGHEEVWPWPPLPTDD